MIALVAMISDHGWDTVELVALLAVWAFIMWLIWR